MEGTRLRGAGRLCRERPKSFLVPREGSALSNLQKTKKRTGARYTSSYREETTRDCVENVVRNTYFLAANIS